MYVCTLPHMTLIDAQKRLADAETEIVVDWSQVLNSDSDANVDQMIEWISTYPKKRSVHVYLGSGRHNPTGRKLQNALQALGCVVTNRSFQLA